MTRTCVFLFVVMAVGIAPYSFGDLKPIDLSLMTQVSQASPDVIHGLIRSGADVNAVNQYGSTPIVIAVTSNKIEVVRILIEAGARFDVGKWNPLEQALRNGYWEIAEILRKAGANSPNIQQVTLIGKIHECVRQRDSDVAVKALQKLQDEFPEEDVITEAEWVANLLSDQKKFGTAIDVLQEIPSRFPDSFRLAEVFGQIAGLEEKAGDEEAAITTYKELLQCKLSPDQSKNQYWIFPAFSGANLRLGQYFHSKKDWVQSLKYWTDYVPFEDCTGGGAKYRKQMIAESLIGLGKEDEGYQMIEQTQMDVDARPEPVLMLVDHYRAKAKLQEFELKCSEYLWRSGISKEYSGGYGIALDYMELLRLREKQDLESLWKAGVDSERRGYWKRKFVTDSYRHCDAEKVKAFLIQKMRSDELNDTRFAAELICAMRMMDAVPEIFKKIDAGGYTWPAQLTAYFQYLLSIGDPAINARIQKYANEGPQYQKQAARSVLKLPPSN